MEHFHSRGKQENDPTEPFLIVETLGRCLTLYPPKDLPGEVILAAN